MVSIRAETCPSCGAPSGEPQIDAVSEPRKKKGAGRTASYVLLWIGVILCCSGLLFAPSRDSPARPVTGQNGVLRSGSGVIVAVNDDVYDRVMRLSVAKDEMGFAQLVVADLAFIASDGTQIRVIEPGIMTYEVRVLSGPHRGRSGIVAREFVHK